MRNAVIVDCNYGSVSLENQEYIKHEPEYRCKGKNNQKKKKVKDTFDDKLELGKFHSVFSEKIRL